MEGSDLPTGLSWKRGFFTNQTKRQYTHPVPAQARAKRNSKIQCPPVEKSQNKNQWSIPTSAAVHPINYPAMINPPAPSFSLNDTIATVLRPETSEGQSQHDSATTLATSSSTEPHSTPKNDDGHIHRASPIRGLPPEHELNNDIKPDNTGIYHQPMNKWMQTTGTAPHAQQHRKRRGETTPGSKVDDISSPALANLQSLSPSPDAHDGAEAEKRAIDDWSDHQDCLQTTPQSSNPTLSDDAEENSPQPPTRGPPLEEPLEDPTRHGQTTVLVTQKGVMAAEPWVTWT